MYDELMGKVQPKKVGENKQKSASASIEHLLRGQFKIKYGERFSGFIL